MGENKKSNEEVNIKINISFIKTIKEFFLKMKEDTKKINRKKTLNIKKYIFILIIVLILGFIGKYAYNQYFYYKIPTIGEESIKVFKDEEPESIIYFNGDAIGDKKLISDLEVTKLLYGGKINSFYKNLDLDNLGKVNSTFGGYMLLEGKTEKDRILKKIAKANKQNIDLDIENIGKLSLMKYGNLNGDEGLYSQDRFKKLNSLVSNNTILAYYSEGTSLKELKDLSSINRYNENYTSNQILDLLDILDDLYVNNIYLVLNYNLEKDILNFKIKMDGDDEIGLGDLKGLSNIINTLLKSGDSELVEGGLRLTGEIDYNTTGLDSDIEFNVKGFKKFFLSEYSNTNNLDLDLDNQDNEDDVIFIKQYYKDLGEGKLRDVYNKTSWAKGQKSFDIFSGWYKNISGVNIISIDSLLDNKYEIKVNLNYYGNENEEVITSFKEIIYKGGTKVLQTIESK